MAVIFRADATQQIGSGHVMRSLALAQSVERYGALTVFLHNCPPSLRRRLSASGIRSEQLLVEPGSVADAEATIAASLRWGADWVVSDGYNFGADYQQALRDAGLRVLRLDDLGDADGYPADLVLNQNPSASVSMYAAVSSAGGLLLGPKYALIRDEFRCWIGWQRVIPPQLNQALVTLGGNPQAGLLRSVVGEVRSKLDHVRVFPGQMSVSDRKQLEEIPGLEVFEPTAPIAESMVKSDLAVSAAGSTVLELLFLGLPTILIDLVRNQTPNAKWLAEQQIAIRVPGRDGLHSGTIADAVTELAANYSRRIRMSIAAADLVDGHGADRVVEEMAAIVPLHRS